MGQLEYPQDLRYTVEHEWVRDLGAGRLRVGITSFAQDALGDVVFVSLPEVGAALSAGSPCGEVESTKSVSELYAPVDGTVVAVNGALEADPELVNQEPYEQGWMFEVEAAEGAAAALLDVEGYRSGLE